MTLREYVDLVRRRWVALVVGLLLGVVGAVAFIGVAPRQYTAEVTVFVSARGAADSVGSAYQGVLLAQQRIPSYTELVTSDRLMRETVERLSLDTTPVRLRGEVTVTNQPDSTILHIGVRDASPQQAALIANKVAERFIALVDDIEKPNDPNRIPAVSAYLLEPSAPPSAPSSPQPLLDIAFGILLGLVAGVVIAVVRHSLDTRISTPAQLAERTGTRTLGSTVRDSRSALHPLVMRDRPYSENAEGYRQLWTNLRFGDATSPHTVVVVTSATGGEGKTSVACNLALAGVETGARVLLVDANVRSPKVGRFLGLDDDAPGLVDVLQGSCAAETAIRSWNGLDVLPAGLPPEQFGNAVAHGTGSLFEQLKPSYDRIIVDAPALLLFADASALASEAEGVLLVVRYGAGRAKQVVDATNALDAVSARLLGSVLTMSPERTTASGSGYRPVTVDPPVTDGQGAVARPRIVAVEPDVAIPEQRAERPGIGSSNGRSPHPVEEEVQEEKAAPPSGSTTPPGADSNGRAGRPGRRARALWRTRW